MNFRLRFPSPYSVLLIVIVLCAVATWLLPAGSYAHLQYSPEGDAFVITAADTTYSVQAGEQFLEKIGVPVSLEKFRDGSIKKPVSIPGTYTQTKASPQGAAEILFAPIKGIYEVVDIILFVLVIGGFIGVFNRSGAFDEGIAYLAYALRGRESLLIIIVTSLIALGGTTFGMAEETFAFYPILVPVFLAAGYDLLVPVAVIFIGSSMGTMGAVVNPFGTIIASDAAGVSWTIGFYSRLFMLIIGTTVSILYILRYAKKVKASPGRSMVHHADYDNPTASNPQQSVPVRVLKPANRMLLLIFAFTFVVMIYGVSVLGWWFEEMTALFLVAAILVGFLQKIKEREFVKVFIAGAQDLLGVSFIIGIARGVTFILNEGQISDTILFYATHVVEGMPVMLFVPALMLVFAVMTLFISSSSGLAVISMPILSALSPVVGVPPEEIVNAYLFGFGLMTFITPTGLVLPSLAMVNVNYNTWLKFIWPLLVVLGLVAVVILWIGTMV